MPLAFAVALLLGGGLLALVLSRRPAAACAAGAGAAVIGCALGEVHAIGVLRRGPAAALALPWHVPYGGLRIETDALSAFFLVPLFALGAAAAIHGAAYLRRHGRGRALGPAWMAYDTLLASMAVAAVARHAVLLLAAWEVMVLSSYVCVTFEHDRREVARAGWTYLAVSHAGMAALTLFFLIFGREAGGLDFDAMQAASPAPAVAGLLFGLAIAGFGAKAGFAVLHVWVPEAHAAAPSHVSSIMSGVMVKMGLYGVLRTLLLLRAPPSWAGPALGAIGAIGAIGGIALASQQRDLKRAFAYSTVENVGLATLGMGIGAWGWTTGRPAVAALGMAAALLHVWNHALMKGLIFLCAGNLLDGTGTRDLERLGGVLARMPRTGLLTIVGGVAIAGLPPLNGFVSEWLIYLALLEAALSSSGAVSVVALLLLGALSLAGALAGLAFVRSIGVALLGKPRSAGAAEARESPASMVLPIAALAGGCIGLALAPEAALGAMSAPAAALLRGADFAAAVRAPVATIARVNAAVAFFVCAAVAAGAAVLRRRPSVRGDTWACAGPDSTARMQYTACSFSEALSEHLLPPALRPRVSVSPPAGLFPGAATFATDCEDPVVRGFFRPLLARCTDRLARLRWMQQGMVHAYLIYVLVALLVGLAWSSAASWWSGS